MARVSILDSGIRVVTETISSSQSASIGLWVGVGSRYEPAEHSGLAHLVEHVLFKGAEKRPTSFDIANAIERVGGELNAETDKEYTGFYAKVPRARWEVGLEVLFDMTLHPLLRPEDIRSEKKVVIEEIAAYLDTPSDHIHDLLDELLWPDQPLGRSGLGSEESVSTIDRSVIRQFMSMHYVPEKMVVSVVGGINETAVLEWLNDFQPSGVEVRLQRYLPAAEAQEHPKLLLHSRENEESHLCFGLRTTHRGHSDRHALRLLNIILGDGMSSRLFQEIRDKRGLAYDVQSGLTTFGDTGALWIYAGVERESGPEATRAILDELSRLTTSPPTARELADAREQFLGALTLRLEDTLERSEWLGHGLSLENRLPDFDEIVAATRIVTEDDLLRVARSYFRDDRLNLAVISAKDERERFEQELHLE
jgi:predicted Zn-dependent peptidase